MCIREVPLRFAKGKTEGSVRAHKFRDHLYRLRCLRMKPTVLPKIYYLEGHKQVLTE